MNLVFFYCTLFLLGAAHALEPGHGKLLVTSYLTGSEAKIKDAFLLGILVSIFHTLSVAVLGAVIAFIAMTFLKDVFANALEVLSGVVILGLGAMLFWRRFLQKTDHEDQCDCHLTHSEAAHTEAPQRPNTSLKEVVLLALASGLTPCPTALAALVAALAMGKALSAFGALVVFSMGIGSVLIVLGIMLIRGSGHLAEKWQRFQHAPVIIARFSTIVLLLLGCYLVSKPFLFPHSTASEEEALQFLVQPVREKSSPVQ